MRTFIVLIPVDSNDHNVRGICETIEGYKFGDGKGIQLTALDVRHQIKELKDYVPEDIKDIEVETLDDFTTRVNDMEFNCDNYFICYVYA